MASGKTIYDNVSNLQNGYVLPTAFAKILAICWKIVAYHSRFLRRGLSFGLILNYGINERCHKSTLTSDMDESIEEAYEASGKIISGWSV